MNNPITTETYKGIDIKIFFDTDAINPFEDWDCCSPLMMQSGNRFSNNTTDYSKGDINRHLKSVLTDGQIIRHQKAIAEIFEIYDLDNEDKETKIDIIRDEIYSCEDFDKLESFCILAKVPHLKTSSRGYSQGDYAKLFFCETPQFLEITGCETLTVESMKADAETFGAWAWGDVYGYTIEDSEENDIGSCWGFYGDDNNKSGLLEHAQSDIDSYLKQKSKKRLEKIKELIKANVPYYKRQEIILNY